MKQNNPYLTGFSRHFFGSAKRNLQVKFQQKAQEIGSSCISDLAMLSETILPRSFMNDVACSKRVRYYDSISTFWAWTSQVLDGNASCSKAVSNVQSWRKQLGLSVPSPDTGAYCKARTRLDTEMLGAISERVGSTMSNRLREEDKWHGFTLKAIDGSSVQLMDTAENQHSYPQPCGQKPGCGFPVMAVCGVLNLSHGAWEGFSTSKWSRHDLAATYSLLDHFNQGDLLLADRAFCSYELISLLKQKGTQSLMRLHQARARKIDWRKGRRIGPDERILTWKRPGQPGGSRLSKKEWNELPDTLEIRVVRFRYKTRGGEKSTMYLATTLLDNEKYHHLEINRLYMQRWEIEVRLRDIKTTLGMDFLRVKTPEMAERSLKVMFIAYNLVKALMQEAAITAGIPVASLSFKGGVDTLLAYQSLYAGHHHHWRKRHILYEGLIDLIARQRIRIRPFRHEPRAQKRRPKKYQLLTSHRSHFREINHRNTYKKTA